MAYPNQFLSHLQEYIHRKLFPWSGHEWLGIGYLLGGLCVGLAVRIGMLWFIDARFDAGDAVGYLKAAQNLHDYHVYSPDETMALAPSLYRPPLYSLFIAMVTTVFGKSMLALQVVQMVVSLITALLLTRVVASCAPRAAPWVFGVMMLSPYEAAYTGVALSETITTFLLVAAAFAILTLDGLTRWIAGGILLGLAALARDIYLPLAILVAFSWIVLGGGAKRARYFEAALLIISACVVVAPWTVRNYVVADRFVPVSDGRLGLSLWSGTWCTNADFTKGDSSGTRIYPPEAYRNQTEKDLVDKALALFAQGKGRDADLIFRSLAVRRMQDEPFVVVGRYFIRAPKLWLGTRFDIFQLNERWFSRESRSWTAAKIVLWGLNSFLMLLGLVGIILTIRKRHPVSILVLPILYTALIYFPLNSFENRYSQPIYPFVLVFAAIMVVWFNNRLHMQRVVVDCRGQIELWEGLITPSNARVGGQTVIQ